MVQPPTLTMGIEEEYLLIDRETRDLVREPPSDFMAELKVRLGDQVQSEFLKSQVEVGTRVCRSSAEAGEDLRRLRSTVADVAAGFGWAPVAASTHPFAHWDEQVHTPKARYDSLAEDLKGVAQRMLICGMHVHIGIEDPDLRIDLMNQVSYFLPHLLAFTGSSPFWEGHDMGLASYRLTVFDALPRTGTPDRFESDAQYRRLVDQLVAAGAIKDGTMIWWDVRPSARFPTLEARIMDVCTPIEDALAVAALYRCILSMLFRLRQANQRWRIYPTTLVRENRWRAQRYGCEGEMVDFGTGELKPFPVLVDELVALVEPDAERLSCLDEIAHLREIARRGTSTKRQRALFEEAQRDGCGPNADRAAFAAVVDHLTEETVAGL